MSDDLSPRHRRRMARLNELLREIGGPTQAELVTGTPRTHFSAMAAGKRGLGDALAAKLERAYDKPEGWFDDAGMTWPFARIDIARVLRLNPEDLAYVEGRLETALEIVEMPQKGDNPPQTDSSVAGRKKGPVRLPGEISLHTAPAQGKSGVQGSRYGAVPPKRGGRRA